MPLLRRPEAKMAKQFLYEELQHTGELLSLIKAAGGDDPARAASYDLGHPRDDQEVLALLHTLERAQIARLPARDPAPEAGPGAGGGGDDPRQRRPAHRDPAVDRRASCPPRRRS